MTSVLHISDEIKSICKEWIQNPPVLSDVKKVRSIVYSLLHRNIRWTDGFHLWLFAIDTLDISKEKRKAVANICIKQHFTGSGQTVPSYRIPILWEHYLCSLREALAPEPEPVESQVQIPKKIRSNKKVA